MVECSTPSETTDTQGTESKENSEPSNTRINTLQERKSP